MSLSCTGIVFSLKFNVWGNSGFYSTKSEQLTQSHRTKQLTLWWKSNFAQMTLKYAWINLEYASKYWPCKTTENANLLFNTNCKTTRSTQDSPSRFSLSRCLYDCSRTYTAGHCSSKWQQQLNVLNGQLRVSLLTLGWPTRRTLCITITAFQHEMFCFSSWKRFFRSDQKTVQPFSWYVPRTTPWRDDTTLSIIIHAQ